MAKAKIHWRPGVAFSYPVPSQGPRVRTFLMANARSACMSPAEGSTDIAKVTCKRCLHIREIGRFDTAETVNEVLSRGCEPDGWKDVGDKTHVFVKGGERLAAVWFLGGHVERPDGWNITWRDRPRNYGPGFATLANAKAWVETEIGSKGT